MKTQKLGYLSNMTLACAFLLSCNQSETVNPDFELHPDFSIDLICAEPQVLDPVDLVFRDNGDLYVLEMPGYPDGSLQSRIVHLVDHEGDGYYEDRQVYADGLRQATSFMSHLDGFLVAAPPDIIFIADRNEDQVAEFKEVWLTGFAEGNLQHNINGLTYGLDNYVYGANGGNGGAIYWEGQKENVTNLHRSDFRLHPKERIFEKTGRSSGGFEIALNDWGHYFGTHNLYHIRQLVFPERYYHDLQLQPLHTLHQISDHETNGLARIFAIGDQNTRVNHPEQSGYFSGACGIEHYGGDLFSDGFKGNIFVADVVLNLIHRDVVTLRGSIYEASRGRDRIEFLASRDRAFRPVNMKTGPDGALYILDMHRTVIEHPEWIPDEIEETMDLTEGRDQGRIYRVYPKGKASSTACTWDQADVETLIKGLDHPNQVCRIMVQQQLVDGHGHSKPVADQIRRSYPGFSTKGKIHAIWTLEGIGEMTFEDVKSGLQEIDARVCEQAIIASEHWIDSPAFLESVVPLCRNKDDRVKLQAVLTLGMYLEVQEEGDYLDIVDELLRLSIDHRENQWMIMAIAATLCRVPQISLNRALKNEEQMPLPLVRMLALRFGQSADHSTLIRFIQRLEISDDGDATISAVISGIADGLDLRADKKDFMNSVLGSSLKRFEGRSTKLDLAIFTFREKARLVASQYQKQKVKQAIDHLTDDSSPDTHGMLAALDVLRFSSDHQVVVPKLIRLLDAKLDLDLQLAAIRHLQTIRSKMVAEELVKNWSTFSPAVRKSASDILIYQEENHEILLAGLESGDLPVAELNFDLERRRQLLWSEKDSIRERAEVFFSDAGVVTRKEALNKVEPIYGMEGNIGAGEDIFIMHCSQCHQYKDQGKEVGPDLTECNRMSKRTLVHHILDPNAVAEPSYINHIIELNDGTTLSGILDSEDKDGITVKLMGGKLHTIPRNDIKSLTSTGLSFMPEGLESQMNLQELADLVAFLQQEH